MKPNKALIITFNEFCQIKCCFCDNECKETVIHLDNEEDIDWYPMTIQFGYNDFFVCNGNGFHVIHDLFGKPLEYKEKPAFSMVCGFFLFGGGEGS